ncbi:MAG TPA: Sbal_3080 family lipoprotein [Telluria sp.]
MNAKSAAIVASALALAACTIQQTVQPVTQVVSKTVCVVENTGVKPGFLEAYRRTLTGKGYQVRQLPPTAALTECPVTSTYSANWRWDMALYMEYAEINVYNNAQPVGKATYDARSGGGNMSKFIDADKKVAELADKLFPGGAGS